MPISHGVDINFDTGEVDNHEPTGYLAPREAQVADEDNIPCGECLCTAGCGMVKDNRQFTFYTNRFTKDGLRLRVNTNCRGCQKRLQKENKLAKANVSYRRPQHCECCKKSDKRLETDHRHGTNIFRGYICKDCNVGLGKLGDNLDGLLHAATYLAAYSTPEEAGRILAALPGLASMLERRANG